MRLATINLDWLNKEIERYEISLSLCSTESYDYWKTTLNAFKLIRSKCTPILKETNKENLPKTCLNQWEDKKYCSNEGMCQMCKIN